MFRRTAPALFLLLLGLPGVLSAQYFGRNKVQYTNFDFKVIQTEHFDVYFYERERVASMDAARMAERSYARLSKVLNHEFRERKPIILYASHSDFQQTNALGEPPSEGTGGVTDFQRNRAVMPFTLEPGNGGSPGMQEAPRGKLSSQRTRPWTEIAECARLRSSTVTKG